MMIRHVVSWNFRPELTEEQRQSVREEVLTRLHALKGQLSYLRDIHAYCPPLDGSNCDLVSHVVLDSEADLARYQKDPDHLAVVPLIQANFCDRRCCDIPEDGL